VSAGKTAQAIVFELFVEAGISFADLFVEDGAQGRHGASDLF
jgi:hypothetical protein